MDHRNEMTQCVLNLGPVSEAPSAFLIEGVLDFLEDSAGSFLHEAVAVVACCHPLQTHSSTLSNV